MANKAQPHPRRSAASYRDLSPTSGLIRRDSPKESLPPGGGGRGPAARLDAPCRRLPSDHPRSALCAAGQRPPTFLPRDSDPPWRPPGTPGLSRRILTQPRHSQMFLPSAPAKSPPRARKRHWEISVLLLLPLARGPSPSLDATQAGSSGLDPDCPSQLHSVRQNRPDQATAR